MVISVADRYAVGDLDACPMASRSGPWRAVIHACKSPCHQAFVGYRGSLKPDHSEYLWAQRGREIALNLIDPDVPLFKAESFIRAMDFMDVFRYGDDPLLIHCNTAQSRSLSILMLYLTRRLKTIPDDSYATARAVFETMLPPGTYQPGKGIETFLTERWGEIR